MFIEDFSFIPQKKKVKKGKKKAQEKTKERKSKEGGHCDVIRKRTPKAGCLLYFLDFMRSRISATKLWVKPGLDFSAASKSFFRLSMDAFAGDFSASFVRIGVTTEVRIIGSLPSFAAYSREQRKKEAGYFCRGKKVKRRNYYRSHDLSLAGLGIDSPKVPGSAFFLAITLLLLI